jgi:hypothetical protein
MIIFMDYELNNARGAITPYEEFVARELREIVIQRWKVLKEEIEIEEVANNAFTVFVFETTIPTAQFINFSPALKRKLNESLKDANLPYLVGKILQKWNSLNS